MPKLYSSKFIAKVLEHEGFIFISQKGSHMKFRKTGSPTLTVIVPAGKEIPYGTFRSILRQSKLSEENFKKK
ncbi:type II toxin-antitoxin system HicA family toxin [Candidatus Peregrinibacteria bacterium]|nr:type II toxin-antitoxin system HicA family toxin [Candidatus Peregrinibacteria bacterium]